MNILCDTDVLSCFAKIKGLQLLKQLFPNALFLISTAVYEELIVVSTKIVQYRVFLE